MNDKYKDRIKAAITFLIAGSPTYARPFIEQYRNGFAPDIPVNERELPYWSNRLPRSTSPLRQHCLYALLSALILAHSGYFRPGQGEFKVLTLLKAVEKIGHVNWYSGKQKLMGDDKVGYTFEGLAGI